MDYLWTPWRYAYLVDADPSYPKGARKGVPQALAAWPGDCNCVFCNLIAATRFAVEHGMPAKEAERAAHIVLQAEHCFVCLNAFPYTSGHVMVVPYAHEETLAALDQPAALEMMMLAQRTDAVLRQVYGAPSRDQHGVEPWSGGGSWNRGALAYACLAAVAGGFELYDRDWGDTGASRNAG